MRAFSHFPPHKAPSEMSGHGWQHDRPSRHARGYGSDWVRLRKQVLSRDRHLCQPCIKAGRPALATEVDHICAKAEGGTDDMANLQAICSPCHKAKTAGMPAGSTTRQKRWVTGRDGWPVKA